MGVWEFHEEARTPRHVGGQALGMSSAQPPPRPSVRPPCVRRTRLVPTEEGRTGSVD